LAQKYRVVFLRNTEHHKAKHGKEASRDYHRWKVA
jgi:hypothetical protein